MIPQKEDEIIVKHPEGISLDNMLIFYQSQEEIRHVNEKHPLYFAWKMLERNGLRRDTSAQGLGYRVGSYEVKRNLNTTEMADPIKRVLMKGLNDGELKPGSLLIFEFYENGQPILPSKIGSSLGFLLEYLEKLKLKPLENGELTYLEKSLSNV